jgi:hypothetical protein
MEMLEEQLAAPHQVAVVEQEEQLAPLLAAPVLTPISQAQHLCMAVAVRDQMDLQAAHLQVADLIPLPQLQIEAGVDHSFPLVVV